MPSDPGPVIHLAPVEVAPETFLLRSARRMWGAPLTLNVNSLVIRGTEPIVVDTGTRAGGDDWLADLASVVPPAEVRWVVLSQHDETHSGNLDEVLERCPNAVLVTSWSATWRGDSTVPLAEDRLHWIGDSDVLDVGDRVLRILRPPVYGRPTCRALFDPTTGALWSSDLFSTPMPLRPVDRVDELPPSLWAEGMAMLHHHALAPWLKDVDRHAYAAQVVRFRDLDPTVVVAAHSPIIVGPSLGAAFEHLARFPDVDPPPHPAGPRPEGAPNGPAG